MCDPLSIGSMAVGAAGSALSGYEQNQSARSAQNARNAATMAELERNRGYGEKSRAAFDQSLNIFDPVKQGETLASAQGDATDTIRSNAATDIGSLTTGNAPRVVGESEKARLGDVFTKGAESDQRLGNLKGYGGAWQNNNFALNDNARTIDMYGDFARTSAGVNQIEQRAAAQNAARRPSGLGDLLSFAGNVGAYYGGRGGSIFDTANKTAKAVRLPAMY